MMGKSTRRSGHGYRERSERERIDAEERARREADIDDIDSIDGIPKTIFQPVPEFPTGALPREARALVEEASRSIACAPDLIALPTLAALGAAIGNTRIIRPKRGWTEGANLYAAVVADSGEKKTAAIAVALEPLQREQRRLNREYEKALQEHARDMRQWKGDCARARKDEKPEPPPPPEPVEGKALVNDTTTEALIPKLRDNPRGVLQERDEIAGWLASFDQYRSGHGADRQFWLSAWSLRPVQVDRKGQAGERPLAAPLPFVAVIGGIQPDVLGELAGGREDGMLERFLVCWPPRRVGRYSREEISEGAESGYCKLIARLRGLHLAADDHGDPKPQAVTFAPDALEVWIDAYDQHRDEMAAPWLQPGLRAAWSKLEAYLLRLTLICACCRFVTPGEDGTKPPERVETGDVLLALGLVDYFKTQARAVHAALRGEDKLQLLLEDVSRFLSERGGSWKGEMAHLHEALRSRAKPAKPNVLSRRLNEFHANPRSGIKVEEGSRFDAERGQGRRVVEISLSKTVDCVDCVDGEEEE